MPIIDFEASDVLLPPDARQAVASNCRSLMPGMRRFQAGIDITKLDLLSLGEGEADEDGFRYPIVDLSCNEGNHCRGASQRMQIVLFKRWPGTSNGNLRWAGRLGGLRGGVGCP